MSSKSKWDQPASTNDDKPASSGTVKDGKSASDAAAAAAAIAAKIAAQFASGALKDEAAFQRDIDINDVRNRYMLTKGSTQEEVGPFSHFASCISIDSSIRVVKFLPFCFSLFPTQPFLQLYCPDP